MFLPSRVVLAIVISAALAGCQPMGSSWGVYGSSSSVSVGGESRQYALETITRDGRPHLVLVVNGSSGGSSSAGGGQASGQFRRPTGETIAWQCNEIKGNPLATIAGRQYDLTRGGLFLVDARTDPISVEQVAFDPQVIQASQTRAGLEQMAKTDPKLHAFLQACWGAGPVKTAEATPVQPDE